MDVMATKTDIAPLMNSKCYIDEMLNMNETDEDTGTSEVTKFYDKRNILITGSSGFMGKLLIDKLLRTCPNMGKLYMMIRPKKGKTSEERFKEQFEDSLYDRLKREQPNFASHVIMIEGDTSAKDLGLSYTNRELLIKNTHIVFHGAAVVNFDTSIRKVVNTNVRGTKLMLLLAKEMKNLKAFVHISTAYSHCPLRYIEEKYYKPAMEVDKVLNLVEVLDDDLLEKMKTNLIGAWPNTYAFSKALSEDIVRLYSGNLPACIVRPSIMLSTAKEPVCGWVNNLYGATGLVASSYVCLIRACYCKSEYTAEMIPADYVINNVVVAGWDISKTKKDEQIQEFITLPEDSVNPQLDEPPIYNCVTSCQNPIKWKDFLVLNQKYCREFPSHFSLWYIVVFMTNYKWLYSIYAFFLHFVPAVVIDTLARLTGRKPMLLKTYQKIDKFMNAIEYFTEIQWKFNNDNVMKLWERTNLVDRKKFVFNVKNLDWDTYMIHHVRGMRVYLLKDPMTTLEKSQAKHKLFKNIHFTMVAIFCGLMVWIAISIFQICLAV